MVYGYFATHHMQINGALSFQDPQEANNFVIILSDIPFVGIFKNLLECCISFFSDIATSDVSLIVSFDRDLSLTDYVINEDHPPAVYDLLAVSVSQTLSIRFRSVRSFRRLFASSSPLIH